MRKLTKIIRVSQEVLDNINAQKMEMNFRTTDSFLRDLIGMPQERCDYKIKRKGKRDELKGMNGRPARYDGIKTMRVNDCLTFYNNSDFIGQELFFERLRSAIYYYQNKTGNVYIIYKEQDGGLTVKRRA